MCEHCSELIKAIDAYIAKQNDDLQDDLDKEGFLNAEDSVSDAEQFEDELTETLNRETRSITGQLKQADTLEDFLSDTWETLKEVSSLSDDIQEVFEEGFSRIMPKLVNAYLQNTDMYLIADKISARTTSWIGTWSEGLGSIMKLTSHEELGGILSNALKEGKGVKEAAREIMDSGIRSNYSRARSTALTEMLTAHSVAAQEGMMQSPVVESKEWRHSGGRRNRVRPNHVAIDGQVKPKADPFELRGKDGGMYYPDYPRDTKLPASERVNCHCIHRAIVDKSVLGLSLEERKKLQQRAIEEDDRRWLGDIDEENKRKADITDPKSSINSLLPNANYGILKPTEIRTDHGHANATEEPNAVIDIVDALGRVNRHIYDDQGRPILHIDNSNHSMPKTHPFWADNGAHYNRARYSEDGDFIGFGRCRALTAKMRRLAKDIIDERVL